MITTPSTPTPPTQEQMLLRARLDELSLREVDRRFEEWCARRRGPGPDAPPGR